MKKLLGGGFLFIGLLFSMTAFAPTAAQAASLTSAQVQAVISLLQSFGVDAGTIANVQATLGGSSSALSCSSFADLTYGNFDNNPGGRVSQLQTWLGISSSTFGFGTYGRKTLAAWNSRCGGTQTTPSTTYTAPTNTQTTAPNTTTSTTNVSQTQTNPVIINSFTVSPTSVTAGQSVTFSWSSNLTQNDITQNGGGCYVPNPSNSYAWLNSSYGPSGSFTYTPAATATYALTCYSGGKSGSPSSSQSQTVTVSAATNPATTINVTYPQSGNVLANSTAKSNTQIATIQWNEQNGNYPVNIWLLNSSGQILKLIANNAPDTGSYVWAYDPSLQSGTYEIEIDVAYTAGSAGGQDRAYSGFFTLQTSVPNMTVTYPNGGEQISYNTGKDVDFNATWTATNYSNTVYVFLSSTSGSLCLLGSAPSSQGTFPITIGTNFTCQNGQPVPVSGGQYKIYVAGDDGLGDGKEVGGYSGGYFTLTAANPTSIPVPVINSFTVSSNSITSGQSVTFNWNVANWNSSSVTSLLQQTGGGCWLENSINPYGGQSVQPVSSYTLTPTASATYTLECDSTGKGDGSPKASQQVSVTVTK